MKSIGVRFNRVLSVNSRLRGITLTLGPAAKFVIACTVLSSLLFVELQGQSYPQSSSANPHRQSSRSSTTKAAPAILTPAEKEAQTHYRVALEALKNNDLNTAADELKAASTLVPNSALIWYNLAVVESKKEGPKAALEHLHKAEALGLSQSQRDDADQLEAKLIYQIKRMARAEQLNGLMTLVSEGSTYDRDCAERGLTWHTDGSTSLELTDGTLRVRILKNSRSGGSKGYITGGASTGDENYQVSLADLDPQAVETKKFDDDWCGIPQILLTVKTRGLNKSVSFVNGPRDKMIQYLRNGQTSEHSAAGTGGATDSIKLRFSSALKADQAAQELKELIQAAK